jgi:hypothetical protein
VPELRRQIVEHPNLFLQTSDYKAFDKGILDSLRQLTQMSVTNRSKYALHDLAGEVQWISDAGELREKTLFRLRGSIAAGDIKVFRTGDGSLDSGTVESHAHKFRVAFTTARVLETLE